MDRRSEQRRDSGSAIVDFVLITIVLVPLVLGIVQLGLVLYVRNVAASAASEGARYGATLGHSPGDGAGRAESQLRGVVAGRVARVSAGRQSVGGAPGVVVTITVKVPALGLGGPAVSLTVRGHAVTEQP